MDDSWSWDGSLVSLNSSIASSSSNVSSPSGELSRVSSFSSISLPPLAAIRGDTSPYRQSYRTHTPPQIRTRPPSPARSSDIDPPPPPASPSLLPPLPSSLNPPSTPPEVPHSTPHSLSSILLEGLSPPASPNPSLSSFPHSASRSRVTSSVASGAGNSRPGRGRTRVRRGSAGSSTASTDGSLHGMRGEEESEDSETSSAEENHGDSNGSGLVMPSISLDSRTRLPPARPTSQERINVVHSVSRLLILGRSAEDRRTLAALISNDDDSEGDNGGESRHAASDLDYSFLSMRPRSPHTRTASESSTSPIELASNGDSPFTRLSSYGSAVILAHPTAESIESSQLASILIKPLEHLERIINPRYPSTEKLRSVVTAAGVGDFDVCLFLFSSPPTWSEIAYARPISHLVPILPVLILPPSPTSKPQKTTALSNAVIQQLDSAGVRWISAISLERRSSRSPPRAGGKGSEIGGGPLTMLPHDLFMQHPLDFSHSPPRSSSFSNDPSLVSTPAFPSPTSTSGPTSLTSSQELPPPLSPTFTSTSQYSFYRHHRRSSSSTSSSRAASSGSNRSLSPSSAADDGRTRNRRHRHSNSNDPHLHRSTLNDLYRLRRIVHSASTVSSRSSISPIREEERFSKFRRLRAMTFLEWREVEVAARGIEGEKVEDLPREWEEKEVVRGDEEDEEENDASVRRGARTDEASCAKGGRRALDFSKRVAERRKALASRREEESEKECCRSSAVGMELHDQEENVDDRRRRSLSSILQDPTTPKPGYRHLLQQQALTTPTAQSSPPTSSSDSSDSSPRSSNDRQSVPWAASTNRSDDSSSYFPPYPAPPLSSSIGSIPSSTSSSSSSSSLPTMMTSSSILMRGTDPFHLPSLLQLVGLNLRLALFRPFHTFPIDLYSSASSQVDEEIGLGNGSKEKEEFDEESLSKKRKRNGRSTSSTWWRNAAIVGIVFAAGVVVGIQVVDGMRGDRVNQGGGGKSMWDSTLIAGRMR